MTFTPPPRTSLDDASSIALSRYQTALTPSAYSVIALGTNTVYYVRIVFPKGKDRFTLMYLPVIASHNGEHVMVALQELHANVTSRWGSLIFIRSFFWTTVVEIATLSNFSPSFLEAQNQTHEVTIESCAPSSEFTAAFQHPSCLHDSGSFVEYRPSLIASLTSREALLLTPKLKKQLVLWGFFAAMIVSVCIGIAVGVVWKEAALGVETTTGLLTGISIFGGLLLWISK